jgi:hypothetical protein
METCGAADVNDIAVVWIPCQSILYTIFGYQPTGGGVKKLLFKGFSEGEWSGGVAAYMVAGMADLRRPARVWREPTSDCGQYYSAMALREWQGGAGRLAG